MFGLDPRDVLAADLPNLLILVAAQRVAVRDQQPPTGED